MVSTSLIISSSFLVKGYISLTSSCAHIPSISLHGLILSKFLSSNTLSSLNPYKSLIPLFTLTLAKILDNSECYLS